MEIGKPKSFLFIDGSIKNPQRTDIMFDAWEKCDMMVLSWIIKTLSHQMVESVIYVDNVKYLWVELSERFSKGNHFKISYLLQDCKFTSRLQMYFKIAYLLQDIHSNK